MKSMVYLSIILEVRQISLWLKDLKPGISILAVGQLQSTHYLFLPFSKAECIISATSEEKHNEENISLANVHLSQLHIWYKYC